MVCSTTYGTKAIDKTSLFFFKHILPPHHAQEDNPVRALLYLHPAVFQKSICQKYPCRLPCLLNAAAAKNERKAFSGWSIRKNATGWCQPAANGYFIVSNYTGNHQTGVVYFVNDFLKACLFWRIIPRLLLQLLRLLLSSWT